MSQRQLARECGVSASFVSQLERGKKGVTLDTLKVMARVLDATLLDFSNEHAQSTAKPTLWVNGSTWEVDGQIDAGSRFVMHMRGDTPKDSAFGPRDTFIVLADGDPDPGQLVLVEDTLHRTTRLIRYREHEGLELLETLGPSGETLVLQPGRHRIRGRITEWVRVWLLTRCSLCLDR